MDLDGSQTTRTLDAVNARGGAGHAPTRTRRNTQTNVTTTPLAKKHHENMLLLTNGANVDQANSNCANDQSPLCEQAQ